MKNLVGASMAFVRSPATYLYDTVPFFETLFYPGPVCLTVDEEEVQNL